MPADETCVPVGVALSNPMGLISSHRRQTGVDGCQKSIGFDVILLGSVLLSRFFCFVLCCVQISLLLICIMPNIVERLSFWHRTKVAGVRFANPLDRVRT